ncbi:MAG: dTDP-4-amino-4,6-dideoxygalactose transaminase [Xanthobacteraceae bacterium]
MSETSQKRVAFSLPDLGGHELDYVAACLDGRGLAGDGSFTQRCHDMLSRHFGAPVLLTHSCTAAMEMAAILFDLEPGDEVIMPSYTFASTANAFVLRGAIPVFVDIRPDTLNLDESRLGAALTPRTRAVVPVHYAGVGCEMDAILDFASANALKVLEDAAQGYLSSWHGRPLGGMGNLGALSFHASKNVVAGEAGLLVINDAALGERAQIIREKGTNRTAFLKGEVNKYEWLDVGSSFLPSDLVAAVLLAQLEAAQAITARRQALWAHYHDRFAAAAREGRVQRPVIPAKAAGNAHIYYLIFESGRRRDHVQSRLKQNGIAAYVHYIPLHSSPAGRRYGRCADKLAVTDRVAETMLRLPLHGLLTIDDVDRIADTIMAALADGSEIGG